MTRILSESGNVIAADFRRRRIGSPTIEIKTRILYQDEHVVLTRVDFYHQGKPISKLPTRHIMAEV